MAPTPIVWFPTTLDNCVIIETLQRAQRHSELRNTVVTIRYGKVELNGIPSLTGTASWKLMASTKAVPAALIANEEICVRIAEMRVEDGRRAKEMRDADCRLLRIVDDQL